MKKLVKVIKSKKKIRNDISGPQPSKMTIDDVMKDMEQVEEIPTGEYPQCPHGPWRCPYKTLWPMFKEFGEDYMGHIPTCNLCVQWSLVKQTIQQNKHLEAIARNIMLLRYNN